MAAKGSDVKTRSERFVLPEFIDIICADGETVRMEAEFCRRTVKLGDLIWQRRNSINVDFDSDIVNKMLEFFRHGNAHLDTFEKKKTLYRLSYEFDIPDLKDFCREDLNDNANEDNVCSLHDLACEQDDTDLQYYCWKKFDTYSSILFSKDDFLNCKKDTAVRFVSRPISTVLSEMTLYSAVYMWASRRKEEASDLHDDLRPYLDEFIPNIRFLSMNRLDLEFVFTQDVFNEEEKQKIMNYLDDDSIILPQYINKTTDGRTPDKYPTLFEYINQNGHTYCLRIINKRCKFIAEFKTDYDCFLIGLHLPIIDISNKNGITVNIDVILGNSTLVQTAKCLQNGKITLKPPVFISKALESVKVITKIPEEEKLSNPNIHIVTDTFCYMTDEEFRIREEKKDKKHIDNIYAEVKLWF